MKIMKLVEYELNETKHNEWEKNLPSREKCCMTKQKQILVIRVFR